MRLSRCSNIISIGTIKKTISWSHRFKRSICYRSLDKTRIVLCFYSLDLFLTHPWVRKSYSVFPGTNVVKTGVRAGCVQHRLFHLLRCNLAFLRQYPGVMMEWRAQHVLSIFPIKREWLTATRWTAILSTPPADQSTRADCKVDTYTFCTFCVYFFKT